MKVQFFQLNGNVTSIMISGKKQDIWYVVDLMTGEKQQTLTSSFAESLCPSTSLLYLGRTGHMLFFTVV